MSATKQSVLGALVDRAVCMPYAKPQLLRAGRRRIQDADKNWTTGPQVRDDVVAAASLLFEAFSSNEAANEWSQAEVAVDPAGPWWSKPRDDFFDLDEQDQGWVLDRLERTAGIAAACVQEEAEDREWTWLWSQPSFASPGKLRPTITRPDLVGGLDHKRCDIIDLKTTSGSDLEGVLKSDLHKTFSSWASSMEVMGFVPESRRALVVSTVDERHDWLDYPPRHAG